MRRSVAVGGLLLLNQVRWARRTRPEPLPVPPAGSVTVVTADGTHLHAQVGGRLDADVTVVFVHGFLARTLSFDSQWQALGSRARLIRYDHRGHGRSDHNTSCTSVAGLSDDLADVISQLAPEGPIVLVGHSMGGMTTMALASRRTDLFRERVVGVALIATGAGHYLEGHRWENLFRAVSRRHLLAPLLLGGRMAAPALEQIRPRRTHTMRWAVRKVIFGTADVDHATLAMTQDLLEGPPMTTMASLQGSLLRNDVVAALEVLRSVPVLVLTGAEDRLTRPQHSVLMAASIGDSARLVLVPGAGHIVNQTRPVEVNAALGDLLDRVETSIPTHDTALQV